MEEKIEKREKTIKFIGKWFLIAIILFFIIQLGGGMVIAAMVPKENKKSYNDFTEDYIGHWYNGTYFINMMVSENFASTDSYKAMKKEYEENKINKISNNINYVCMIVIFVLLIIILTRNHKKKLIEGITPIIILISGVIYLLNNIIYQLNLYIDTKLYAKYTTGFLQTAKYYFQAYYCLTIPTLLISLGLVLMYIQKKNNKKTKKNIELAIRLFASLIILVGLSFTCYRFGVRIYELIMVLKKETINVRLPYYYFIFDLPYNFAKTPNAYINLVILRFIKDLPVFITTIITIILFVKILLSSLENKLISKENDKLYKIIFILLITSSIIFNILGLVEVKLLNNNFLYQYKEATYTIGIRSFCEPIYYGLYIYLFKHFSTKGIILSKKKKNG